MATPQDIKQSNNSIQSLNDLNRTIGLLDERSSLDCGSNSG